jgi:hypothetical protein
MASPITNKNLGLLVVGLFIVAAIASFFAIAYIGILFSWWLILPVGFMLSGLFLYVLENEKPSEETVIIKAMPLTEEIETEIKSEYQAQLANALEKFTEYAQGKISKEELERYVPKESEIYQFLSKSQEAHFMLSLKAQIDGKPRAREGFLASVFMFLDRVFPSSLPNDVPETTEESARQESFKKTVISLLDNADKTFHTHLKKPQNNSSAVRIVSTEEDNAIAFKKLFDRTLEKTEIKRKIVPVEFNTHSIYLNEKKKYEWKLLKRRLAIFATKPDGNCVDYCINMQNREETINAIIQYFPQNKILKKVVFEYFYSNVRFNDSEIDAWEKKWGALKKVAQSREWTKVERDGVTALVKQIKEKKKRLMNYNDDEKFKVFIRENLKGWLDDKLAAYLCLAKYEKTLIVWNLPEANKPLNPVCSSEFIQQQHYLHFFIEATHATRLVEIDDFEELINATRHENHFELSQTQESYEMYMQRWINPSSR